jgi:hypothetical protein
MTLFAGSRHLGDDDLIRYIDHQLDHEGMRLGGAHLRTCAECAARLDAFQQQSALVHDFLSLLPGAEPDAARKAAAQSAMERARFRSASSGPMGTAWMRMAASIVLLLGLGLATEPGRAFVAQGIVRAGGRGPVATRMVEWLGQERQLERGTLRVRQPAAVPPPAVAAEPLPAAPQPATGTRAPAPRRPAAPRVKPGMSAAVHFMPAGPDVTLTFASVQPRGSAALWIREGVREASVQATSRYNGEELATSPAGVEVRNSDGSRADYTIVIPARYRYIRVRVGDGPEAQIHVSKSKQEWLWTIPLQNSALQEPDDN